MADVKPTASASGAEASSERRRSLRLQIMMPVIVRAQVGNAAVEEETHTVAVNANGCMVRLSARLARSQQVSIINPKTAEELPCKVTFVGQSDGKKTEIGLEFAEASPLFWRIAFPPEDWDPSERKRPIASPSPKRP
jgi:PilZ domain